MACAFCWAPGPPEPWTGAGMTDRAGAERLPGAALPRDISRGEQIGHEINAFVTKRHNDRVARGEGERAVERHQEDRCYHEPQLRGG
jgi:hypothetical protein